MYPHAIQLNLIGDYRLSIRFEDGTEAELDFAPMLTAGGIFNELKDPARFAAVRVDSDAQTIVWPNGADICPDVLYHLATGAPLPGPLENPPARRIRLVHAPQRLATSS